MGASDELLKQVFHFEDQRSTNSVLCAMPFYPCPDHAESQLNSFVYLLETLSDALISLELLINRIDDGLRSLDGRMSTILELIAAESFQAVEAKNLILADPLYRLGVRSSPQLIQCEARLQAVSNVLAFHRSAINHVTESRGRLSAVKEELKMVKRIAGQLGMKGVGKHLRSLLQVLRGGLMRLQSAQHALSGGNAGSPPVEMQLSIEGSGNN